MNPNNVKPYQGQRRRVDAREPVKHVEDKDKPRVDSKKLADQKALDGLLSNHNQLVYHQPIGVSGQTMYTPQAFNALQQVRPGQEGKTEAKLEAKTEAKLEAKTEAKTEAKVEVRAKGKAEPKLKAKVEAKTKAVGKPEAKIEAKTKAEAKLGAKPEAKPEVNPEAKLGANPEAKLEAKETLETKKPPSLPPLIPGILFRQRDGDVKSGIQHSDHAWIGIYKPCHHSSDECEHIGTNKFVLTKTKYHPQEFHVPEDKIRNIFERFGIQSTLGDLFYTSNFPLVAGQSYFVKWYDSETITPSTRKFINFDRCFYTAAGEACRSVLRSDLANKSEVKISDAKIEESKTDEVKTGEKQDAKIMIESGMIKPDIKSDSISTSGKGPIYWNKKSEPDDDLRGIVTNEAVMKLILSRGLLIAHGFGSYKGHAFHICSAGHIADLGESLNLTEKWSSVWRSVLSNGSHSAARMIKTHVKWIYESFIGVYWMHRNGLVHVDLKPPNCTIVNNQCCLIDFEGTFRVVRDPVTRGIHDMKMTERLAPPERFRWRGSIGFGWDIWTQGMIMLQGLGMQQTWNIFKNARDRKAPGAHADTVAALIRYLGVVPSQVWCDTWEMASEWTLQIPAPRGSVRSILESKHSFASSNTSLNIEKSTGVIVPFSIPLLSESKVDLLSKPLPLPESPLPESPLPESPLSESPISVTSFGLQSLDKLNDTKSPSDKLNDTKSPSGNSTSKSPSGKLNDTKSSSDKLNDTKSPSDKSNDTKSPGDKSPFAPILEPRQLVANDSSIPPLSERDIMIPNTAAPRLGRNASLLVDETTTTCNRASDHLARAIPSFNDTLQITYGTKHAAHLCELFDGIFKLEHDKRLSVEQILASPFWDCDTFLGEKLGSIKSEVWTPPFRDMSRDHPSHHVYRQIPLPSPDVLKLVREAWNVPILVNDEYLHLADTLYKRLQDKSPNPTPYNPSVDTLDRLACIGIIVDWQSLNLRMSDTIIPPMLFINATKENEELRNVLASLVREHQGNILASIRYNLYSMDLSIPIPSRTAS